MIVPESDRALIRTAVAERGLELEEVREDQAATTWHVTVVVDGDSGVTLDHLAALSADLDDIAEQWGGPDRAVTFEVTSRGVDAPLTEPRHWRRARGRQVDLSYVDGADGPPRGRVGDLDEDIAAVRIVSRSGRGLRADSVALSEVARAVLRVEFRPAPEGELALLSDPESPGRGVREGEKS